MRSITRSRFATLFALSLVLLTPAAGLAQDKHKLSWSSRPENTKYTVQQQLEIADVPAHVIRMFDIQRTFPEKPPMVEGLKVVEEISRGVSDTVAGNGRASGYASWRHENGDMLFAEWQQISQAVTNPDGSRKATFMGTFLWTGGTGKLRGIKGFGRFTGLTELAADGKVTRNEYSGEGEYWMGK